MPDPVSDPVSAPAAGLHLLKLCVGARGVEDLQTWQARRRAESAAPLSHVTRMRPKRAEELLNGGSLYWVFQGRILARQRIIGLEEVTREGRPACAIQLGDEIIRTVPAPRRPFQGWRYLNAADAPADLAEGAAEAAEAPPELLEALSELGVA